jgi:hypothetical protein
MHVAVHAACHRLCAAARGADLPGGLSLFAFSGTGGWRGLRRRRGPTCRSWPRRSLWRGPGFGSRSGRGLRNRSALWCGSRRRLWRRPGFGSRSGRGLRNRLAFWYGSRRRLWRRPGFGSWSYRGLRGRSLLWRRSRCWLRCLAEFRSRSYRGLRGGPGFKTLRRSHWRCRPRRSLRRGFRRRPRPVHRSGLCRSALG